MKSRTKNKTIFLIGIGGAGMTSLALLAKDLGYQASGSDIKDGDNVKKLRKKGIKVFIGHNEKNISSCDPDLVVYSSAIKTDNPELVWAKKNLRTIKHRFEFLAQLIKPFRTIAMAGTHGKTSTTSMAGFLLQEAKIPSYVYLGGENICLKEKKIAPKSWVVLETDESDRSFLWFDPTVSIVTNIDKDHLSNYHYSFEELKNAFRLFIKGGKKRKLNIICADDKDLQSVAKRIKNRRTLTYGLKKKADLMAVNIKFSSSGIGADIVFRGKNQGRFQAPFLSEKHLLNAMGAMLAAKQAGVSFKQSFKIFKKFKLPKRRNEIIGEKRGVLVIDDHADHPTEVKATLSSLKVLNRRIIAVYEPHRYTRMKMLGEKAGAAFDDADIVISLDLCAAFEKPIKGISGAKVHQWIKKYNPDKKVYYIKKLEDVPKFIKKIVQPNDLIVTLGPGAISGLAQKIFAALG